MNANSVQVGGSHYQSSYQHWDFVARVLCHRYLEGNITKYLSRWRNKGGVQDLHKARHYLQKLIEDFQVGIVQPIYFSRQSSHGIAASVIHFCEVNRLRKEEAAIITRLADWQGVGCLFAARNELNDLIAAVEAYENADGSEPGPGYVNQG